jgi:hypothetical protein
MKILPHQFPIPGQRYSHYKGGYYQVLHLAQHTETQETLVIYQSLHFGTYHARPLENWIERVNTSSGQRFSLLT